MNTCWQCDAPAEYWAPNGLAWCLCCKGNRLTDSVARRTSSVKGNRSTLRARLDPRFAR